MVALLLLAVIITNCEAARILSSKVEYLSARRYSSSMVVGGSRERDLKKEVVGFFRSSIRLHPYYTYQFVGQLAQISR